MSAEQQQFYLLRVEKLKELVGSVFMSGEAPNVYDVSALVGKLPNQDISDWKGDDLVDIPGTTPLDLTQQLYRQRSPR